MCPINYSQHIISLSFLRKTVFIVCCFPFFQVASFDFIFRHLPSERQTQGNSLFSVFVILSLSLIPCAKRLFGVCVCECVSVESVSYEFVSSLWCIIMICNEKQCGKWRTLQTAKRTRTNVTKWEEKQHKCGIMNSVIERQKVNIYQSRTLHFGIYYGSDTYSAISFHLVTHTHNINNTRAMLKNCSYLYKCGAWFSTA